MDMRQIMKLSNSDVKSKKKKIFQHKKQLS